MKSLIKLEELGVFALSVFLLYKLNMHISWWLYIILFFSPDIGMIGYLINTKVGAVTYNLFHHKAVGSILIILGVFQTNDYWLFAGLLFLAHSSFDRILGYGLKYTDSFKHTNVGYMQDHSQLNNEA
ncbi:MAG: DUF4260 domain-containing protein [Ferruginibacter sp.]